MPLTAAQNTAFFTAAGQMGISNADFNALNAEEINLVSNLDKFNKEDLEQIAKNIRAPAAGGVAAVVLGAKSLKRLIVACDLVRFYNMVGRPLLAVNIQWTHVMKNFALQCKQ